MNAKSFCNLPFPHCKGPIATTLLPFLYQTRTIQSPRPWPLKARRFFRTDHLSQRVRGNRDAPPENIPYEDDQRKRPYRVRNASSDAIPFEGNTANQPLGGPNSFANGGPANEDLSTQFIEGSPARPLRASTITASESAIFERIFNEISSDAAKKAIKEEDDFDDDGPIDTAYDDLNAVFEEALQSLKRRNEDMMDMQASEKQSVTSWMRYRTAIAPSRPRPIFKLADIRGDENLKRIQKSVEEHKRKVQHMLDEARTDVEIWKVLDMEVFSLIHQYEALRKEVEGRGLAIKPRRRKASVSKSDQAGAGGAEKQEPAAKTSAREAEFRAIISSNYGDYCLAAMRRLRSEFPMSPYCMNMLPAVKRLGPISTVLAASVELYNETLFLQWKEYSDLHGMADLILEMGHQSIESNEVTLKILKMVQYARRTAITEDRPMKLWWHLEPVERGWQGIKSVAKKVRYDVMEARTRRTLGEDEARDGEIAYRMRVERAIANGAIVPDG
ncbi:MAG: hypothetical protein Q9211_001275 [Gyalolechia sp. 1 TL-2023]